MSWDVAMVALVNAEKTTEKGGRDITRAGMSFSLPKESG